MNTKLQNLRSALLNWYPFSAGARALLLGDHTEPLAPLLKKYFRMVDTAAADGVRYNCIAATDLVERTEDIASLLQALLHALDDNGVLLLAFRNRFGLKYLCGGTDGYVRTAFSTLQPIGSGERLYARNEMKHLLFRAGFAPPRFYYLMPDADFVQAVYTDDLLPEESIRDRVFPFDLHNSPLIAWESDLYDDMVREGVLPFVANVYLAECRKPGAAEPKKNVVYAALSTDRGEENSFATVLYSDGTACKKPLYPKGLRSLERVCSNMAELSARGVLTVNYTMTASGIEMPLVREEGLLHYLRRQLPDHPEAFLAVFDLIWKDVLRSSPLAEEQPAEIGESQRDKPGPILQSALIDMIPYNAFWVDGRIRYYDQEFRVENCPARYVLFRALRYTWLHIPEAEKTLPLEEVKRRYGLEKEWNGFMARENRFVAENRNVEALKEIYDHVCPDRSAILRRRMRLGLDHISCKEMK